VTGPGPSPMSAELIQDRPQGLTDEQASLSGARLIRMIQGIGSIGAGGGGPSPDGDSMM
jgi:hypothetical protein